VLFVEMGGKERKRAPRAGKPKDMRDWEHGFTDTNLEKKNQSKKSALGRDRSERERESSEQALRAGKPKDVRYVQGPQVYVHNQESEKFSKQCVLQRGGFRDRLTKGCPC
jgi:hypothetical protein